MPPRPPRIGPCRTRLPLVSGALRPARRGSARGPCPPPEPGAGRAGSANDSRTLRSYGIGAQILRDLGVGRMKLLTRERRIARPLGRQRDLAQLGLAAMGVVDAGLQRFLLQLGWS